MHTSCAYPDIALAIRWMITFSLFNIPIRVLPWFWITLALIGGVLGVDSKDTFFKLLLFLIAGFISILVHELGHALTAKSYGKRVEIVLQAFGGYAAYGGGAPLSRLKTFFITAAGPAIQIALGFAVFGISKSAPELSPQAFYFLETLYWISFVWAILNLLPVLPMDGGRIMETILGPKLLHVTLIISIVVAVAVALLGLLYTGSILLPVFMGMMAFECFKALRQLKAR
jgi:stage IV sporulation protein FB